MKFTTALAVSLMSTACVVSAFAAAPLVYLSCDVPPIDGKPGNHFDFTLDEANSTVSYYVKAASATNTEKAVFGPESVTWSVNLGYLITLTRKIDRTNLHFDEEMDMAGNKGRSVGQCVLVETPKRAF